MMGEVIEILIILKDEERTMKQKFLHYGEMPNWIDIHNYIKEAKKNFPGDPENIVVKTTMVVQ